MIRLPRSLSRRADGDGPAPRAALSRLEVLVLSVVSAIVLALAGPLIVSSREAARRTQCEHNLQRWGTALHAYHDQFQSLPPAAFWSTSEMHTLALHLSKRHDLFTGANWTLLLLPFAGENELSDRFDAALPIAASGNAAVREKNVTSMICPADDYNRSNNPHVFEPVPNETIRYARGNYAINGGTHSFKTEEGSTASAPGDHSHLVMDRERREFRFWGNGIAGINQSFSIDDFDNGQSTLVALEEIRAGIHGLDPRGAWALGQIASSITWGHGVNGDDYGPNNPHPRSDDICNCGKLHELLGSETLEREGMPCVSYLDHNQNATARSRHLGGVNVLFLDGAVRFVSDRIDPGLWHVMHSRETPRDVLAEDFEKTLTRGDAAPEAPTDGSPVAAPDGEPLSTLENSLGMKFVLIPSGEFTMGLPDAGNEGDLPEECPAHHVRLTRPFYLDSHEVTQRQFEQLMARNPSFHLPDVVGEATTDNFPVEQVTWNEARDFCRKLGELPNERAARRRYRLPTEAEWEYASRSGSTEPYRWPGTRAAGDESGDAAGIQPELPLKPVGSYPPNSFGLYDMRGNVWEWCADWFDRDYYARSPVDDPRGPAEGFIKVVRGSDWTFVGEGCKINYPMLAPWKANPFIGFRVVCEFYSD